MTDPVDDAGFRALLTAEAELVEVDVDAEWTRLVASLEAETDTKTGAAAPRTRRPLATWAAVAAAIVLLLSTVGRPVVVATGEAIARFVGDKAEQVGDTVGGPFASNEGSGDKAHGKVDKNNAYWVEVRAVHDKLNDAVGWGEWKPKALEGLADRLDRIVAGDPRFTAKVRDAAAMIRSAQKHNRRDDAVGAHRLIAQIETSLGTSS